MSRCIHCTRCVRFTEEIAGLRKLVMANRGEHSEIMPFICKAVEKPSCRATSSIYVPSAR